MFVMTAKLSKSKLIAAGVLLLAAIVLIIVLACSGSDSVPNAPMGASNDERVAYLATFGWSVNAEPTETQKVKIPEAADDRVFARYNDLQKSQGFDLTDYAGKEVMRYVYEVLNYPDATDPVYASVLVCDGYIIGGDVLNTAPNGVIHGFQKPSQTATPQPSKVEETAPSTEPSQPAETTPSAASE